MNTGEIWIRIIEAYLQSEANLEYGRCSSEAINYADNIIEGYKKRFVELPQYDNAGNSTYPIN